ncbi:helix-turn-helix transcriptional regulator [Nocardioides aestuarii]|uniref:LuxR C-terminal-related transcriptional regulator n=1 Tax=Nocardioides aestuarii TaxID=252231 RepID=A0ABW4TLD6_9ACTN
MRHLGTALGLSAAQEQLYQQVLPASGQRLAEVSSGLLRTPDQLLTELGPLVREGIVRVHDGTLEVAPPSEVVVLMLTRWAASLAEAGDQLTHLARAVPHLAPDDGPPGRMTDGEAVPLDGEVVVGGDVPSTLVGWIEESADDLLFLRPDQWRMPSESAMAVAVTQAILEGREARAVYPARALREAPSVLVGRATIGEQIRVVPEVPTRLAVIGNRAMVPEPPGLSSERRVIVRQPAVVDMFRAYFEALWDRAVAVPALERGDATPDLDELLLAQLAEGAKDEQIARILGISLRTVRRRVAAMMTELGVDSRFQAGVEAVRRGWL